MRTGLHTFSSLADVVRCAQGITLSEQQLALASARVKAAGVEARANCAALRCAALRCVTRAMREQTDICLCSLLRACST
jgi:hypothetical protein